MCVSKEAFLSHCSINGIGSDGKLQIFLRNIDMKEDTDEIGFIILISKKSREIQIILQCISLG